MNCQDKALKEIDIKKHNIFAATGVLAIVVSTFFLGCMCGKKRHLFQRKLDIQKAQGKQKQENPEAIILIYQMGKVGSISIDDAIRGKLDGKRAKIIRLHYICNIDYLKTLLKHSEGLPESTIECYRGFLRTADEASKALRDRNKKIFIITGVREPVSQKIASYFQRINVNFPGHQFFGPSTAFKLLREIFFASLDLEEGDFQGLKRHFFDTEMKEATGIDVYQYPFDQQAGYQTITRGNIHLLIYKFEKLSDIFPQIEKFIKPYLNGNIALKSSNIGSEKAYAKTYDYFKKHIQFDRHLLEAVYKSKYAQHFYSQKEIQSFYEKWGPKKAQ